MKTKKSNRQIQHAAFAQLTLEGTLDVKQTIDNVASVLEYLAWVQTCSASSFPGDKAEYGQYLITRSVIMALDACKAGVGGQK